MATARGSDRRVSNDTIVAIATPPGPGGLGVIRLSGPEAVLLAASVLKSKNKNLTKAPTHTLHVGWICDKDKKIDQAVASLFRAPNSYTGEDVVEISCHGSPALLHEVVKLFVSRGARLAKPGEFTERAYLNGKMDLAQAEAVAELIHAGGAASRAAAVEQLRGNLSSRVKEIREGLIRFLAHLEANLDFVEEDIPGFARESMARDLQSIQARLGELLSASLRGRLLREGFRVALAGRPNVGKSSLFNALLASERAIVTTVAGTTRDILEEKIEWDGLAIVLSDTAGLRKTKNIVEKEGARRSRRASEQADLVLWVVDASHGLTKEDRTIAASLKNKSVVAVLNKTDRGQKIKPAALPIKMVGAVETSATKATGLANLKKAVLKAAWSSFSGPRKDGEVAVTALRHVAHLEKAAGHIGGALAAVKAGRSEEVLSVFVREALNEIGMITGESVTDDVLSAIFRQFCVGK